jgi:acid phosphatase family membrane protein YuiD
MAEFFQTSIWRNEPLITAGIGWLLAAFLKFLIVAITSRRFDWERLLGTGGMPSTHTTPVVACTTSIGLVAGFDTAVFALATVITIIVSYDATGIRRHAGEQARAINSLINDLTKVGPYKGQNIADFFKRWNLTELQTLLGHNPFEVFIGVLLGIMTALVVHFNYGHLFIPAGM